MISNILAVSKKSEMYNVNPNAIFNIFYIFSKFSKLPIYFMKLIINFVLKIYCMLISNYLLV